MRHVAGRINRSLKLPTVACNYSMNRPRNRQPRLPRTSPGNHSSSLRDRQPNGKDNVPSIRDVVPGASVSIVLKADQPTGRETQGRVKDVLTRGDHPRGIKVRLLDGQIGRVQRMVSAGSGTAAATSSVAGSTLAARQQYESTGDLGSGPDTTQRPPYNLADYIRPTAHASRGTDEVLPSSSTVSVKCPMCDFEGDTAAVSHHVQTHLD